MKQRVVTCLALLLFSVVCFAIEPQGGAGTASAKDFSGVWNGTWEGAGGNGGFELTVEKEKDSGPGGRVSVTGEPTYKATLKTLTFDGQKMSAKYDFPPDDRIEVVLAATFDGNTAKGTWSARAKDGGAEVAAGSWNVTRK